jgi:hypothetical protein
MNIVKKGILATTIAASALASTAAPALARDRYYGHHDNTAGVAIGAGILGLAVGAIVASDHNDRRYRDSRYDDRRYYANDGRYYRNDRYNDRSRYDDSGYWQRRGENYDGRYYGRRGY